MTAAPPRGMAAPLGVMERNERFNAGGTERQAFVDSYLRGNHLSTSATEVKVKAVKGRGSKRKSQTSKVTRANQKPKAKSQDTKAKSQKRTAKPQKPVLGLSPISIRQQLAQAGFVLVFFGVLLVLRALHRWRCSQHGARRSLHRAGRAKSLELFLFRHNSYLTTKGAFTERQVAKPNSGCIVRASQWRPIDKWNRSWPNSASSTVK